MSNPKSYLFIGNDEFRRYQEISKIIKQFLPESEQDTSVEKYDSVNHSLDQINESIQTPPFLSEKKVIIIQNLSTMIGDNENKEKLFWSCLSQVNQNQNVIIFCEDKIDKRKTFFKKLKQESIIQEFEILDENKKYDRAQLVEFCREKVHFYKRSIQTSAINYIIDMVGANTRLISSEIEKIDLFLGDSVEDISISVCQQIISKNKDAIIFDLTDAVLDSNLEKALKIYQKLVLQKESPQAMLSLIGNIFKMLIQIKSLNEQHHIQLPNASYYRQQDVSDWIRRVESQVGELSVIRQHPYRIFIFNQAASKNSLNYFVNSYRHIINSIATLQSSSIPNEHTLEMLFYMLCSVNITER